MSTMKVYKCYQVYGYKEAFFWQPLKTHPYNWDEITVQLPEGAELVKTEFGSHAGERTPAYRGGSFLLQREQRH